MTAERSNASATLLADGRVLIAGGIRVSPDNTSVDVFSADLYDPSTGTFTATGSLNFNELVHLEAKASYRIGCGFPKKKWPRSQQDRGMDSMELSLHGQPSIHQSRHLRQTHLTFDMIPATLESLPPESPHTCVPRFR